VTPDFLISTLDDIDAAALRARINQARSEITDSSAMNVNPNNGEITFVIGNTNSKISFQYHGNRMIMRRDPTESSRSLWIGECECPELKALTRQQTKEGALKIIDRWESLLDIPQYFSGTLNTNEGPGDDQRMLAASYVFTLEPEEKNGLVTLPLRNPYTVLPAEIRFEGKKKRWISTELAQHIIDQTPLCARLEITASSYEFGPPNLRSKYCHNTLDPITRMRLINELKKFAHPIRKTKPKA
jgi:hypothetical protein